MKKLVIALSWGTTWWHIFPLLALYQYFQKKHYTCTFIWFWEKDKLEYTIATTYNIEFCHIPTWKIRRYFDIRNFYEPFKNIGGIFWAFYFLSQKKVDIIFSKWGSVSLPVCIAGFLLRKKIFLHESDAIMGIANRIISLFATKVFYSFLVPHIDNTKHIFSWQIVTIELLEHVNEYLPYLKKKQRIDVAVLWWSQGSTFLFEEVLKIIPEFPSIHFTVILWEKNQHFRASFEKYKNVTLYDFVNQKEIGKILTICDIAIMRWGATSLWETYFFWIHGIIVPLKGSAQNHQYYNARFFQKHFWYDIVLQSENTHKELQILLHTYKHKKKRSLNMKHIFFALKKIEASIFK